VKKTIACPSPVLAQPRMFPEISRTSIFLGISALLIGEDSVISKFLQHLVLEHICTEFCKNVVSSFSGEEMPADAGPTVKLSGLILTHMLEEVYTLNAFQKIQDKSWSWSGALMSTGRVVGESCLHLGAETLVQILTVPLVAAFSQLTPGSDVPKDFFTMVSDFAVFVGIENLAPKLFTAVGLA